MRSPMVDCLTESVVSDENVVCSKMPGNAQAQGANTSERDVRRISDNVAASTDRKAAQTVVFYKLFILTPQQTLRACAIRCKCVTSSQENSSTYLV